MKKFAFIIAAVAAVAFIAGCATDTPQVKTTKHTSYHSKLGKMSTKHDVKK